MKQLFRCFLVSSMAYSFHKLFIFFCKLFDEFYDMIGAQYETSWGAKATVICDIFIKQLFLVHFWSFLGL